MRTLRCLSDGVMWRMAAAAAVVAGLAALAGPAELRAETPAGAKAFRCPEAWTMSSPLICPEKRTQDATVAVKDPTLVFSGGKWHMFMTIKCEGWTPFEYVSFDKWDTADAAPRKVMRLADSKYYCAPQVFYFRPHKKWYLIYQVRVPDIKFLQVGYSTTTDIADPNSWTKAQLVFDKDKKDPRQVGGLDFWIICDDKRAYLFYTSLNGKMWRLWTTLAEFPHGFRDCQLALSADIFEASHTYRLKGLDKYLTLIEANPGGRRYYKAYLADRLDGKWTPLADSEKKPFVGAANVSPAKGVEPWADNISHVEFIRDGVDETMTVDPNDLRVIFQGATQAEKAGKPYGKIPWRIGMLTPTPRPGESTAPTK